MGKTPQSLLTAGRALRRATGFTASTPAGGTRKTVRSTSLKRALRIGLERALAAHQRAHFVSSVR